MYKKSWGTRGVSPIIAAILMVAMSVVLTSLLFFTVQEMAENRSKVTPVGALYTVKDKELLNYTIYMVRVSEAVEYEDLYIVIQDPGGNVTILGHDRRGLTENLVSGDYEFNLTEGSTHIVASDTLYIRGHYTNHYEGTIVKFVYIPSGGQVAYTILD